MLSNLLISIAILCLGFWLKGLDSIIAKIAGWPLFVFGVLATSHALKFFYRAFKGKQMLKKMRGD